jgi:regulator of nucleoside diphosphate kinase
MAIINLSDINLSPDIILGAEELRQLTVLAMGATDQAPEDADWLLHELERARVLPDAALPADTVRMGSTVTYRTSGGQERTVQLVYPGEADIGARRISVLAPVGAALIGLRKGQSISWLARDGRRQALTVLRVSQPTAGAGDDDPGPSAA